jgi:phosphatidylglycerophosphate synthase
MNWSELRKVCKRESDYIITLFITNEVSLLLTWVLAGTRVTPNQVTVASILMGLLCGLSYALGWFLPGSFFLFFSHVLDCTDGNLARAKQHFSSFGRWLDWVGDRFVEMSLFFGACFYFLRAGAPGHWIILSALASLFLLYYYYVVDLGLALGTSKWKQEISSLQLRGVHLKWGLFEPVIYGFVILAPLGLIKVQILLVLILSFLGLAYQIHRSRKKLSKVDPAEQPSQHEGQ